MEVKSITLEDMLKICHINYDGVAKAVTKIANESKCLVEFYDKFHNYFQEHGLGGDSCWELCKTYLGLILNGPYSC